MLHELTSTEINYVNLDHLFRSFHALIMFITNIQLNFPKQTSASNDLHLIEVLSTQSQFEDQKFGMMNSWQRKSIDSHALILAKIKSLLLDTASERGYF